MSPFELGHYPSARVRLLRKAPGGVPRTHTCHGSNRGIAGFTDSVNLTGGSYFALGERLWLGAAVGTPINLNWRF